MKDCFVRSKAIEHTDEVIRRKKNALAAFEHSEENVGYQEIEKQIADIDIRLADATTQANELERKCEALTAKLEAKEKEFWSSGGDLSRNRDAIKLEMQKISSEVERVNEEILQMAVDASTPLFMCRNLVTQSYDNELSSQQSEAKLLISLVISKSSPFKEEAKRDACGSPCFITARMILDTLKSSSVKIVVS